MREDENWCHSVSPLKNNLPNFWLTDPGSGIMTDEKEEMVRELANVDLHVDLHFLVMEMAITHVMGHVCR